jgi:hypothetical protein
VALLQPLPHILPCMGGKHNGGDDGSHRRIQGTADGRSQLLMQGLMNENLLMEGNSAMAGGWQARGHYQHVVVGKVANVDVCLDNQASTSFNSSSCGDE